MAHTFPLLYFYPPKVPQEHKKGIRRKNSANPFFTPAQMLNTGRYTLWICYLPCYNLFKQFPLGIVLIAPHFFLQCLEDDKQPRYHKHTQHGAYQHTADGTRAD